MTKEIRTLSEEMANLSERISNDLLSTLVNLSGSLKDIAYGTHLTSINIKIPMDAGYVKFYKSRDSWNLNLWIEQNLMNLNPIETNDTTEFFTDK